MIWLVALTCVALVPLLFARLWLLNPGKHKMGWGAMYLAMLAGTMAVFAEAMNTGKPPGWPEALLLLAVALNIGLTHDQWLTNNAPTIVKKKPEAPEEMPSFNRGAMG